MLTTPAEGMPLNARSFQYQSDYEAALGRLLVRFNNLEITTGQVLEGTLEKLGMAHLYRADDYFAQKIDKLELALLAFPSWPVQDFKRLRQINGWRNRLAHSDFAQDPNTGEYMTRHVHRTGKKAGPEIVTPSVIDGYSEAAHDAHSRMGQLLPHIWFEPLDDEDLPEGASRTPL